MGKICLIGFMGSGKTTIGMALARQLEMNWVDLDDYIVQKTGQPISTFFEVQGENAFRKVERECLEEVLCSGDQVISTGGGIITSPDNIKKLKENQTVFLSYPFEVLYERIKGDQNRPLVTTYKALHKRFDERLSLYEAASSLQIQCEGKSINDIVTEIINRLNN